MDTSARWLLVATILIYLALPVKGAPMPKPLAPAVPWKEDPSIRQSLEDAHRALDGLEQFPSVLQATAGWGWYERLCLGICAAGTAVGAIAAVYLVVAR